MFAMRPERNAAVLALTRHRPAPTQQQRVIYELARMRVADTREPAPRFTHLARAHD
jgi:hypothetical protein